MTSINKNYQMQSKHNATLKFLQNKYNRNNSLNEKLLLTLKNQAKSHAQSPKESGGFLDICAESPQDIMYKQNNNFTQSTHFLKGRLASLSDMGTRNTHKAVTTLSSNNSQGGTPSIPLRYNTVVQK